MRNRRVIGLTGTVQTGKQEFDELFEGLGVRFLNLNRFGNESRVNLHDDYKSLGLYLDYDENGTRSAKYYEKIVDNPVMFDLVREIEWPFILERACKWLERDRSDLIVVSWEYLPWVCDQIHLDHLILAEVKRDVWMSRIKKKLGILGQSEEASEAEIIRLIKILQMEPERIKMKALEVMPGKITLVDTSGDNWGSDKMKVAATKLLK